MQQRNNRGVIATLVAGAAALLVGLSGASVANAAPGAEGPLILPGNGNEPVTGSVTVHKHEQGDEYGEAADGLLKSDDLGEGIAGVTFTAQRIEHVTVDGQASSLDLATNEGWRHASQLVLDSNGTLLLGEDEATATLATERTVTTGTATYKPALFEDLPIGVYLFEETVVPEGVVKSAPWIMTVPLTHPEYRTEWLYDIHVYPKNTSVGITKSVADAGASSLGETVQWTITTDIPLIGNPQFDEISNISTGNLKFLAPTEYTVTDQLDPRLAYASSNALQVSLVQGDENVTPVLEPSDYSVSQAEGITVSLTESGLNKLALAVSHAATPTAVKVQVTMNTIVVGAVTEGTDSVVGNGVIENVASLTTNGVTVTSAPATTKWGDVVIRKVDATAPNTPLAGASFKIYTSQANAEAGNDPITINSESTFVTGADGTVRISGLRFSNHVNGNELASGEDRLGNAEWKYYWIVETQAPEGYELLAEPIQVAVTAAGDDVTVTQIENVATNAGFELPLTGGMGTAFLTIGGIAILTVVLLLARRRRDETVAE